VLSACVLWNTAFSDAMDKLSEPLLNGAAQWKSEHARNSRRDEIFAAKSLTLSISHRWSRNVGSLMNAFVAILATFSLR